MKWIFSNGYEAFQPVYKQYFSFRVTLCVIVAPSLSLFLDRCVPFRGHGEGAGAFPSCICYSIC